MAARRAPTTTEYSRYADPGGMSESGKKAYEKDVARQKKEIAKSRFIEGEAESYGLRTKHTHVGKK